jgi:hypothetical protein
MPRSTLDHPRRRHIRLNRWRQVLIERADGSISAFGSWVHFRSDVRRQVLGHGRLELFDSGTFLPRGFPIKGSTIRTPSSTLKSTTTYAATIDNSVTRQRAV